MSNFEQASPRSEATDHNLFGCSCTAPALKAGVAAFAGGWMDVMAKFDVFTGSVTWVPFWTDREAVIGRMGVERISFRDYSRRLNFGVFRSDWMPVSSGGCL